MGTSPLSPEDIRAAAGAHHELGPEYSDAVVASFLEKVDEEITARVNARLGTRKPGKHPAEPESRRTLVKGFAYGVVSSVAVVLLVAGAKPGQHALWSALLLLAAVAAGGRWASRRWAIRRRTTLRQGTPTAVGGDYRHLS